MHSILILGGGKSSTYLIDYLADTCQNKDRKLILADLDEKAALEKLKNRPNTFAKSLDVSDPEKRKSLIQESDLVISMLPAFMHPTIAKDCLDLGKHFFSASYESEDLKKMASEISEKGLFFLNECGLDPGIDHMSAMKIIDEAKKKGHQITSFKSYCGGLLAPESEDNPWKYKFTWNPRNVVLAGQGTSRYIEKGDLKFIPYHQLYKRLESIHFEGLGDFDGYANRDSLSYRKVYGLENIPTLLRGTLRRAGYCKAWNVFVQLGMTDDSFEVNFPENSTLRDFINAFLPYDSQLSVEEKLGELIQDLDFPTFEKLQWLGFFSDRKLPKTSGSPASLLQAILEIDWALGKEDRDMIVMQHLFELETDQGKEMLTSSLVCFGEDSTYTAMAKTVGLPLAIAVDLFLDGKIKLSGLHLPILPEIYLPILEELEKRGIVFQEKSEFQP
ncbi:MULTISPECIES: saccharopine dehydrogenase C-terminal domain-containing protein [unclassified Algoriphagus]|jgi:saccharopine dehydrogenase (NADP+, L-glutamate forming)|uniref:saccharopine dehydrogenase C-terminal domain-containing protein n=6 Tax=Algoriphagus TaxID=246875 RepID=UPI000C395D34|nr:MULTISPECIES: saccharopine dehydrogenase C-terminal domain-containing protein [unclassified Algoriphagus]MAL13298.1 saccharopine dehydrogenase [Algoriphagus sp.]QYH40093.1 saccharopine dehydrogenase [Algoriphagus sp. NBT04N3]|tara:strand:- start:3642 stop:4976 length:1335 start_codon:yes stop_codon:yes gene_type:complete